MSQQSSLGKKASVVYTVEPDRFFLNQVTAQDNTYQKQDGAPASPAQIEQQSATAKREHEVLRQTLTRAGINVLAMKGPLGKPDAIFPNNSFSIHEKNGALVTILYPMSPGRRDELPAEFIAYLKALGGENFHDLRAFENQQLYLEGTGALNFSADGRFVYMGRSKRASEQVLEQVCAILGIDADHRFVFDILDVAGNPIYHTNVMSWFGNGIAGICLDSIPDGPEKDRLLAHCAAEQYKLVTLTQDEIGHFAGNALEIISEAGDIYLTISLNGWNGLRPENRDILKEHYGDRILVVDLSTIERLGGGSIRCTQAKNDVSYGHIPELVEQFKAYVKSTL